MLGLMKKKKCWEMIMAYEEALEAKIKKLRDGYEYVVAMPGCDSLTLRRIRTDMERMLLAGGFTNITIKLFGREDGREVSIKPPTKKADLEGLEPPRIRRKKNGKDKSEKRDNKERRR